jgi:fatty-acyl-CoA synthase
MPDVRMVAAVGRPDPHAGEVPVVYVELAEGANATEKDILDWAKENVGERAAVPREIVIVPEIPLTPVGKIFKPRLRWDATRRVYEEELEALGGLAAECEVSVGEDKVHGTLVGIGVKPAEGVELSAIKEKIAQVLTRYTLHYEVTEIEA